MSWDEDDSFWKNAGYLFSTIQLDTLWILCNVQGRRNVFCFLDGLKIFLELWYPTFFQSTILVMMKRHFQMWLPLSLWVSVVISYPWNLLYVILSLQQKIACISNAICSVLWKFSVFISRNLYTVIYLDKNLFDSIRMQYS